MYRPTPRIIELLKLDVDAFGDATVYELQKVIDEFRELRDKDPENEEVLEFQELMGCVFEYRHFNRKQFSN